MTFPFDRDWPTNWPASNEPLLDSSTDGDVALVQHFGAALYSARSCRATCAPPTTRLPGDRRRRRGLRLKLRILAPELLTVPWGSCTTAQWAFVALSSHAGHVRYLGCCCRPGFGVTPPLPPGHRGIAFGPGAARRGAGEARIGWR